MKKDKGNSNRNGRCVRGESTPSKTMIGNWAKNSSTRLEDGPRGRHLLAASTPKITAKKYI